LPKNPGLAENSYDAFERRSYFAGLDGIRCLAIVAVVWHHAPHPASLPIYGRGFLGVDLFFILSGFLITTKLLREKARHGRISLRRFWIGRILRLAPAYYGMLAALTVAYLLFRPGSADAARLFSGLPVYAFYLSNWIDPGAPNLAPTWSLATEEQFYVIWPLVEAFVAPAGLLAAWIAGFAANQLVNFGVIDNTLARIAPGLTDRDIMQATFTPILLGVGLAHLLNRRLLHRAIAVTLAPSVIVVPLLAGALLLLLGSAATDISGGIRLGIQMLGTALLASLVVHPSQPLVRALEWKPIRLVGQWSYGIYLYHMFCIAAAQAMAGKLGLPSQSVFLGGLCLSVAVAGASYTLFERPIMRLKGRFAAALEPKAAGQEA